MTCDHWLGILMFLSARPSAHAPRVPLRLPPPPCVVRPCTLRLARLHRTRLTPHAPASPTSRRAPLTSRLARSHRTRLTPHTPASPASRRAPLTSRLEPDPPRVTCALCLVPRAPAPRASHGHTEPALRSVRPVPRATHTRPCLTLSMPRAVRCCNTPGVKHR
jgi:hypothetical protein